jgi:acid phosphatase type 7
MKCMSRITFLTALSMFAAGPAAAQNTLVPEGVSRYHATPFPDRIVLTWAQDPSTSQAVTWRTDLSVERAVAEIAVAKDTPGLHLDAITVEGVSHRTDAGNGPAHHHSVSFTGLEPGTLYAYRVAGGDTWSEWFQFRTAEEDAESFSFLYFGDAQNAVKSHWSRTVRAAFSDLPDARLMVHAGDLVDQRDGNFDDEWGEWFDAGGWLFGMLPSVLAAGNHEFVYEQVGGEEERVLARAWNDHFTLPDHAPAELVNSVYYVDFQGVRFIVLNSTSALDHGTAALQAEWLEGVLSDNPNRWTVVTYHHPMYSVSLGRDNPPLREHWKPVFDRYGVDLVLQGHDHSYGRIGENLPHGTTAFDGGTGTMYVVSVSGPKMYFASEESRATMTRVGEDVQLYQLVHVDSDRIRFESRTVTGRLYDAFDLIKGEDGVNRLVDRLPEAIPPAGCGRPDIPGYADDRCWEGTDFIQSPEVVRPN